MFVLGCWPAPGSVNHRVVVSWHLISECVLLRVAAAVPLSTLSMVSKFIRRGHPPGVFVVAGVGVVSVLGCGRLVER